MRMLNRTSMIARFIELVTLIFEGPIFLLRFTRNGKRIEGNKHKPKIPQKREEQTSTSTMQHLKTNQSRRASLERE
jgi:hypothetical protein